MNVLGTVFDAAATIDTVRGFSIISNMVCVHLPGFLKVIEHHGIVEIFEYQWDVHACRTGKAVVTPCAVDLKLRAI